jgi:hypothetical protein
MRATRIVTSLAVTGLLLTTVTGTAIANRLAGSQTGGAPLSAAMDGQQEVDDEGNPGVGDPDATGFAVATLNPGQGRACYELEHDVDPAPFGFHIHIGEAGTNGGIVVDFFTQPAGVVPPSGCVDVDRDVARAILADPAGYYFNLHNEPFPAGAIRGQLSKSSR